MGKINVLDDKTIDKIAAGEVVERPASIVKEFVENSIDAGADAITVEIRMGGIEYIRVTDNGDGIAAEDMKYAFMRHATSKIKRIEDLDSLHSMGFRGEALASIASVSKVTVVSKKKDELMGHRYEADTGSLSEIGAPDGTTITAAHLFYNVPVRRKFLKSAASEAGAIEDLLEHLALSRPDISFKFISNGRDLIFTSGSGDLKDAIYRIYGREMARELIPVSYEKDGISIDGYLGTPAINRPNRNFENYFLNGRYIKSDVVAGSLEEGYSGYTMQHKFPFCVLLIGVSPAEIDVNVHPSKMDVRFHDRELFYASMRDAVSSALHANEMIPEADLSGERTSIKPEIKDAPEPFETKRRGEIREEVKEEILRSAQNDSAKVQDDSAIVHPGAGDRSIFSIDFSDEDDEAVVKEAVLRSVAEDETKENKTVSESLYASYKKPEQLSILPRERVVSKNARGQYELKGCIFNTYWLFSYQDKLYFIDQHAAHEKVNYERLINAHREKKVYSQRLSPPLIVSLSAAEQEVFYGSEEIFKQLGFEVSHFGGKDFALHTVPMELYRKDETGLFMDILNDLCLRGNIKGLPGAVERVCASVACRSAVKGGDVISKEEMEQILDDLLTLDNPYHCPHGRPTMFSVTRTEIEKRFKRIVS
ncbi:MAG: DNA mismatch repair endonuclease MutL [Lachnospiraceae bacterium]|nr:DNA mismatch repair endonuclease MutL [Lachnospiraceae bacterium]